MTAPPSPTRDQLIALRLSQQERSDLRDAAARAGMTVSELVRQGLRSQGVPIAAD